MTAQVTTVPAKGVSEKTLGALAVVGVVIAFSLSSTLVKRAHTPGVLVAFWRLATVSVVWNMYYAPPVDGSPPRTYARPSSPASSSA